VAKEFQGRVIWRFVLTVIAGIFLSQLVTIGYLKIRELVSPAEQNLIYFSSTFRETMEFTQALEVLWLPMLLSALLGSLLVLVFGIFFSHRIAGPLFNLKRVMRQVEDGDLTVVMKIREKDEFHDVESSFNSMVTSLRNKMLTLKKTLGKLTGPKKVKTEKSLNNFKTQ
jgi:nitrogen fixation/metabolism regulation signal transduction histidine kinase